MKKIHVCLVSDQTIPNILSIHHSHPDEILFVSTTEMEQKQKTEHILAALKSVGCDYSSRSHSVIVPQDSIIGAHQTLEEWTKGRDTAEFVVNLTCGTKIMSMAAYEFFKDYGARMIYIPLPRNEFLSLYPERNAGMATPLKLRLRVCDYLAAYGLQVINVSGLRKASKDAAVRKDFSDWIVKNYTAVKNVLERLNGKLRKQRGNHDGYLLNTTYLPTSDHEREFFSKIGLTHKGNEFSKQLTMSEICFLTGGWLEEFCYNEIASITGTGIDDVAIGIRIRNSIRRDNEFDVMFTSGNALYTVECKSLDQNDDPKADALYKIAALQKEFGLKVESFFVSTSPHILRDGVLKPAIEARAAQFRTTVVPPEEVVRFGQCLKEKLSIR